MFETLFRTRKLVNIDSKYPCDALRGAEPKKSRAGALTIVRHALMVMGISAMCTLGFMFVKPGVADQLLAFSPFADKPSADQNAELAELDALMQPGAQDQGASEIGTYSSPASLRQQQWVTDWLARRYRVANDAANMLVTAAYTTAMETKLDPLLILSVIAIESRFNPFAESAVGAQGLMQVMSSVHKDRFEDHGGVKAALNPVANIKVGSQILKEYVRRGGSVEAGLKSYVGAANHATDGGYGAKVLAEYRKLKAVASGKHVPASATKVVVRAKSEAVEKDAAAEVEAVKTIASVDSEEKTDKKL